MITRDATFMWRPGRIYIPAYNFAGLRYSSLGSGQASAATIASATNATLSMYLQIVTTSGFTGLFTSSMSDAVNHLMEVPYDMDVTKNIYTRLWWTCNETSASNAVTWALTYTQFVRGTTVLTNPFVALDSVIGSSSYPGTSAWMLAGTGTGYIKQNTINKNTEFIGWRMSLTTHTLAAQPVLLGLEVIYTPKRLRYQDGMPYEAKQMTNVLGDVAAT